MLDIHRNQGKVHRTTEKSLKATTFNILTYYLNNLQKHNNKKYKYKQ